MEESTDFQSNLKPNIAFHQLQLPMDKVRWVDSEDTLEECRQHVVMVSYLWGISASVPIPISNCFPLAAGGSDCWHRWGMEVFSL